MSGSDNEDDRPKKWYGGMFHCMKAMSIMGGAEKTPEPADTTWEIEFDELRDMKFLGAGAQGSVYLADWNGEQVAVKKVKDKKETNLKHLRNLNHKNIVRFRGICVSPPCLLMDFCLYGSMHHFIRSGVDITPEMTMRWAIDISLAVAYLHHENIIHRDLKSPNILVSDKLTVKVSDFGTSKKWKNVSATMSFTGTVSWMAPEMIRQEPCSPKVDIWSYGVVLWELMTRETPFENLEPAAVMWGVGTNSISLPIPKGCPEKIQELINQCLQRMPKSRPAISEVRTQLESVKDEIIAIGDEKFAEMQAEWADEVREGMKQIYAKSENNDGSESGATSKSAMYSPKRRVRHFDEQHDEHMVSAKEIYMEVCTLRVQLEQREIALAERVKMMRSCRCCKRRSVRLQRQPSSTSSDSQDALSPTKAQVEPMQMMVNYVEKDHDNVHTIAVTECLCSDVVVNNNPARAQTMINGRDTVVEQNGNVGINKVFTQQPGKLDNGNPHAAIV